ncbi:unnamed protein product, partial [Closterium sp. NIES-53]
RSTGDPRLILGKGYTLVVLGGYGRTDPLLNKPFYPNGTADSDAIVNFTTWSHPLDLDSDFSPGDFWYSHTTIPEEERTRALAVIQQTTAAATTSAAAETTVVATTSAEAEATTTAPAPITSSSSTPTPAQQLTLAPRDIHKSANFTASFYTNSDLCRRSPGHRADESLWHQRLGHPINTTLNNTIRAGVLDNDSLLLPDRRELQRDRRTCFAYLEADLPHQPFVSHHNPSTPAYAAQEKVYSNILYTRESGQGAYNYVITFINAATRYVWHLNLTSRDMAFKAFVAWLPVAEKESGVKLKSFQSDGGGEYQSQRFKQYLAKRGIKRLISLLYTHQQQGVAERMNRTLQNTMRKLLHGMRLPNHQWPEAMDHAPVNMNVSERIGPNFLRDPEAGDEAVYPEDPNLPRYTQSGLQILGLVTAVHGAPMPREPATVQQALGGEHREIWREAMDRELKALEDRNTWKIVPIGVARNKTILTRIWIFRVKTKADGTFDKFKARWVVRGFDQEHGQDFTETFALFSRHTSLQILLAIAAMKQKKLRQIDVANAFLYAPVDAEIFVKQPHGSNTDPNQVCQLLKSLYGIKQAPRLWQQYLHARLIRIGFHQLPHDQGMHTLTKEAEYILLIMYVDDLLYIGSTNDITTCFEGELQRDLSLTVSSTVTQYL